MYYFAYGSNMSTSRLRERVPSAEALGCFALGGHDLRFHKPSKDGSGKCDAYLTKNAVNIIYGVLFKIDPKEKPALDKAEGLGYGYNQKEITVTASDGSLVTAVTYVATKIDNNQKPYSWYVNHVLVGAREASLPPQYIEEKIASIESIEDSNRERDMKQRAIHS
ncbi:gamma-glutamylcyclotransferase [Klebsiella variicola]|uniref:gamma-glutamylcyclotransferase family protein n=2 Tax=Klebsiella variicola TaxID=244366 RepID=UPI001C96C0B4|nr:gamma-glutamylcyclotransferase family protein [Klebsiella variicola]MBY5172747.1 gamma-glutamylcyclotransferase [Klebsiella variicola]MCK6050577.1 gamma-glutamylcyclotransferase [Klebsiella variicola]HCT3489993.1 gamma-glutamylcyclotransferase [Klebsiella variicola]HCT8406324.1 gamma-glutamylcyclotransferase [Klebsiella variicola]